MIKYQKELIIASLENDLKLIEGHKENFEKVKALTQWFSDTLNKYLGKPELLFIERSKTAILKECKDYINFAQRNLLEALEPIKSNCIIIDTDLKYRARNSYCKSYKMDTSSEFYKKFMMSIGLIDDKFEYGYVIPNLNQYSDSNSQNIVYDLKHSKIDCTFLYTTLKYLRLRTEPSSYQGFNDITHHGKVTSLLSFYKDAYNCYQYIDEFYGIEEMKKRILDVMESEKSK